MKAAWLGLDLFMEQVSVGKRWENVISMKQIKFRSRTERVLRTTYVVMYAFRSKMELNQK